MIQPDSFIPLAEETGLIVPIGRWVLEEACRQTRIWQMQLPIGSALVVGVNLSGRQFGDPNLVADVADVGRVLRETNLDPSTLKLEITESVAMQDATRAEATMHALKELGVQLAIDDFGTGYSSLLPQALSSGHAEDRQVIRRRPRIRRARHGNRPERKVGQDVPAGRFWAAVYVGWESAWAARLDRRTAPGVDVLRA